MFYPFQLGNNVSAAARHICAVLGEDAVADRTCAEIGLRDLVKMTYQWKIVRDPDVLYNLILTE